MKLEIKPVRTANVLAVVYGFLMGIFVLITIPFFIIGIVARKSQFPGEPMPPVFAFGCMLLLYPFFGLVFGWIGGAVLASVYNLVVRWTGGLLLELHDNASTDQTV